MRPRLALFLPEPSSAYQQAMAAEAVTTSNRLGLDLIDLSFAEASEGTNQLTDQVRQIYGIISAPEGERPDAILIMPVQEAALHAIVEKALASGIGVVFINRTTSDIGILRQSFPGIPASFVTPDQVEAGRIQARQLAALLPRGGNVMYVQGRASNTSAQGRAAGFHEGMATTNLQIATALEANWSTDMAKSSVARWLRMMLPSGYRVDAVACQSDVMAVGALHALRGLAADMGRELDRVPVLGVDGVETVGRRLVDEGKLVATVTMPTTTGRAIELLAAWFRDRQPLPPRVVLPPTPYPPEKTMLQRWARATAG
jgi:ABC-type sugar transport system substrate-binding protein